MAKLNLILTICLSLISAISCASIYSILEQFSGVIRGELLVPVDTDITNGWEATLTFDNKILLHFFDNATIKSNVDEKVYTVINMDKTKALTKGSTLRLYFEAKPDKNVGGNLIKAVFNGKQLDIGPVPVDVPITVASIGSKGNYDYGKVLHASLLFYEAQRSGKLPADNRIAWRGDSMLTDKGDAGEDLSGGYFDAGDLVKFGFPMAYSMTVIAWGAIDYESAYTKAGELDNLKKAIKWGTDYFINAHPKETEFYGQVGNGGEDHGVWGRPEDWPASKKRPAYKITAAKPGSDLAGETAAALAAASIVLKSDATYSAKLLTHAKQLYNFANTNRGVYSEAISDAAAYYKSWSGYGDELAWAAAWLYRATNDSTYKTNFDKHVTEFSKQLQGRPEQFSWDDKTAGVHVLWAKLSGDQQYKTLSQDFCDYITKEAPKSPKGMVYLDQWGPLRHAANVAWICLQAANLGINQVAYRDFAKAQIGYALGDTGRSFVVGVGVNPPQRPHHRAASCPLPPIKCDYFAQDSADPNPHILTGALVGGPDKSDAYTDDRKDYVHNEVAMDYNAGFQSAVAALAYLKDSAWF